MNEGKIKSFTDLVAWKNGHELAIHIYKITKNFPKDEIYGLTNQMRRAAVSVTSNIAEGFGRQGYKEKIQFYYLSQGSLTELKNQLLIAKDIGYINKEDFTISAKIANDAHRLLQGLITSSKSFLNLNS
ncbi:MAG: four helix bundle protein [Patescibacteria group bacterium]|nr:four helix bundle protein [Patescibacteria group bacterium]